MKRLNIWLISAFLTIATTLKIYNDECCDELEVQTKSALIRLSIQKSNFINQFPYWAADNDWYYSPQGTSFGRFIIANDDGKQQKYFQIRLILKFYLKIVILF